MSDTPLPDALMAAQGSVVALVQRVTLPSLKDYGRQTLKVGRWRIDSACPADPVPPVHRAIQFFDAASRRSWRPRLPRHRGLLVVGFSRDASSFAVMAIKRRRVDLVVVDVCRGTHRTIATADINARSFGGRSGRHACRWLADGQRLLCHSVDRRRARRSDARTRTPQIWLATDKAQPPSAMTLLTDEEAALVEDYLSSRLSIVDLRAHTVTPLGIAGLIADARPSPDGRYVTLDTMELAPSPLAHGVVQLTTRTSVWALDADASSGPVLQLDGARGVEWMPSHPALLTWIARDATGARDTWHCGHAPFDEPRRSVCVVDGHVDATAWTTSGRGLLIVSARHPPARQLLVIDDTPSGPAVARTLALHENDALVTLEPQQQGAVPEHDDAIFVTVDVRSTSAVVARLDALNLRTGVRTSLLSPEPTVYTRCVGVLATQPLSLLTRHESGVQAPRYELIALDGHRRVATGPPLPRLRSTEHRRQVLQFTRADGVALTGVLHLPITSDGGDRRPPVVVCAHPVLTTPERPTNLRRIGLNQYPLVLGASPLGLVAAGYAVLHDCTFPLVQRDGSPMESYADQMRMSAAACVDALASTGVVDASRIAAYGQSLGGFLVVTLAARPSPFKAVVARSGAYNRPMTPFGFVFEPRRYWEAVDTYVRVSPLTYIQAIDTPLLLIHGEWDDNETTTALQSKQLFDALCLVGTPARYVELPCEGHLSGSVECARQAVTEMHAWCDRWV